MRSARRCGRTGKPVMACRGARRHRAVSPQTIPRTRLAHRCGRGCGRGGGRILGPASRRPCGDREGHSQGFLTFARARARGRNGTNSKDGRRCGSGGRLGSMPRRWASVESRSRSRWIASESVSFHRAGSRNARRTRRSRRAASSTPLSRRNANRSIRGCCMVESTAPRPPTGWGIGGSLSIAPARLGGRISCCAGSGVGWPAHRADR